MKHLILVDIPDEATICTPFLIEEPTPYYDETEEPDFDMDFSKGETIKFLHPDVRIVDIPVKIEKSILIKSNW